MGTTIFYGLLAWVVRVIGPHFLPGSDYPAAGTSKQYAFEDLSTIATACEKCQTRSRFFSAAAKPIGARNHSNL